jgi:hypothetical protein
MGGHELGDAAGAFDGEHVGQVARLVLATARLLADRSPRAERDGGRCAWPPDVRSQSTPAGPNAFLTAGVW